MSQPQKHQSWLRCPLTFMLGSPANVRLLRELSRHGGELSAPSLAQRTGLSVQSVRLALDRLVDQRIIDVEGTGQVRLFVVQRGHPLSSALDGLFMAEEDRFDAVMRALRVAVEERRDAIEAAWLYGSVARGEDTVDSDVDIAIVSAPGAVEGVVSDLRERLRGAEEELSFTASVIGMDSADVQRLSRGGPWWTEIVRDAIAIAGFSPKDFIARLEHAGRVPRRRRLRDR